MLDENGRYTVGGWGEETVENVLNGDGMKKRYRETKTLKRRACWIRRWLL